MKNKELLCESLAKNGGYCKVPTKLYTIGLSIGSISTYTYLLSGSEDFMPPASVIANALNISRPTVKLYLKELEGRNLIKSLNEGGKNTTRRYEFTSVKHWNIKVSKEKESSEEQTRS